MNQNLSQKCQKSIKQQLISHFPKHPYQIQLQIAQLLHQILQNGQKKLAIIQSPTGTGKTYSLLVPLIVWLKKNRTKITKIQPQSQKKVGIPSWLKKPSQQKVQKLLSQKKKRVEQAISIQDAQKQLSKLKSKYINSKSSNSSNQQEIEIQSDQQQQKHNLKRKTQLKMQMMIQKQLKVQDETILPKIIFVSRTHSQLSQVIQSLKQILKQNQQIKYIEIGSKEHLCINTNINKNKLNISERCQYILDHSKCEFFHNLNIKQFFNTNIKDANLLGKNHNLCSYYATRNLIQQCDILCIPYATILNQEIRNRIGINIYNSLIVFDQGHNLSDYSMQLHSPQIQMQDVSFFSQQIDQYSKRYQGKLKISNYKLLIHLLQILRALLTTIDQYVKRNQSSQLKYVKIRYLQFIGEMAIKELKILKIIKYIQLNNLDQKLSYFNCNQNVSSDKNRFKTSKIQDNRISVTRINNILHFLLQFASFNEEKQVLLIKWVDSKSLKILCLQSNQLEKIVNKSRLTIFAGGTMQPLDDFNPLLQKLKGKTIIKKYSHIIKKDQCSVSIIKKHKGKDIIFNHQTLNDDKYSDFIKQICHKILNKVLKQTEKGGGVVVFIQNYRLIALFKEIFKNQDFFSRMLFDGKQTKNQNRGVFQTYKDLVQKDHQKSHILISVMGGKLSQGINFSDRLARSLIVFGLPYANIFSPEIIETITYNQQKKKSSKRQYLQSLCLRTLNQTIGRGVRHIKDYVNIYLIDARFQGIKHKLSEWMRDRVKIINNIQDL